MRRGMSANADMIIAQRREECYRDAVSILMEHNECLIPRGTGFGKTGIMMRLANDYLDGYRRGKTNQRVLYLYPHSSILSQAKKFWKMFGYEDRKFDGINCMTYSSLVYMGRASMKEKFKNVRLVLCDECHYLPADKISKAILLLRELFKDAKLVGATATVMRMDGRDLVEKFFNCHVVREYTLSDMFAEGVIPRPYYVYCTMDSDDSISKMVADVQSRVQGLSEEEILKVKQYIKNEYKQAYLMAGIEKLFTDVMHKYIKNRRVINGIFFFKSINQIYEYKERIENMVRNAYPGYKLNTVIIHSKMGLTEKTKALRKIEKFSEDTYKDVGNQEAQGEQESQGICNIVLNVDILSHGVHIPELAFIAMYRETNSGLVYSQQFGRAIDSGSGVPSIIFDVVDNLHRPSIYREDKGATITDDDLARWEELNNLLLRQGVSDLSDIDSVLTAEEASEYRRLSKLIKVNMGKDGNVESDDSAEDTPWYYRVNDIMEGDVIVVSGSASARDIVRKVDGYSLRAQANRAYKMWIKHFKELNPKEYKAFLRLNDTDRALYIIGKAFPDEGTPPFVRYCTCCCITLERALYCLYGYTMGKDDIRGYLDKAKSLKSSMLCREIEVASQCWAKRQGVPYSSRW